MTNYSKYFVEKRRNEVDLFIACTDEAPDNLRDLIREIHFNCFDGCLANDWVYETVLEAFETAENGEYLYDFCVEADPYYSQLNKWFSNPFAPGLCNEVLAEYLPRPGLLSHCHPSPVKTIYDIISYAQCRAKRMIYDSVQDFIEKQGN